MSRVPYPLAKLGNRLVQSLAAEGHESVSVKLERRRFRRPRFLITLDEKAPDAALALTPTQAQSLLAYLSESVRARLLRDLRSAPDGKETT